MHKYKWLLSFVFVLAAAGQEPPEVPIGRPAVAKGGPGAAAARGRSLGLSGGGVAEVVDSRVRELVRAGAETVPVFIILRRQPQREVLDRHEAPARLRLRAIEARYAEAARRIVPSETELSLARGELETALLGVRRAAFAEIEARVRAEQEEIAQIAAQWGGRTIHRYRAINMLAARLPGAAIDTLAAHPFVAEISLVEMHSAQLATSAHSLGADAFWSEGHSGSGEAVAVMDTGVRSSHPAFAGLSIVGKAFLEEAKEDDCFDDDAGSAEDMQGHGTHVAGIVASRGASGWANHKGVARGLGTLYNLKIGYRNCDGDGSGTTSDVLSALDWIVQEAPWVKVFNYSFGALVLADDDMASRAFDYFVDTYGLTISVAAGNASGSALLGLWTRPGPVSSPGIAHNVITVAAMNTQGTAGRSDDKIAIFSSRGPTLGDRRKPDIAAPGGLRDRWDPLRLGYFAEEGIYSADYQSDGFVAKPGTSMAAPHIAGAAALLRQAGVRDPLAIKAMLLNTADRPDWDADEGWGYADLNGAFEQRHNVLTSSLSPGRTRLYKGVPNGDFHSTLTWNRSVDQEWNKGCLSDLDLFLYDASSGELLNFSASDIDNVEKASATAYGEVAIGVSHDSQSSCRSAESFALAFSPAAFQGVGGPVLDVSCTAPEAVAPSAQFSVACAITNRGDLPALSVNGTLAFAGGASISSEEFGPISPGASSSKTWSVTAPSSSGAFTLQLAARSDSFGALFTGSGGVTLSTADGGCAVAVSPASLSLSATGGSGTVSVSAPAGCAWGAVSNESWITVTEGAQGVSNGTVKFTVAGNSASTGRTGAITVGGQSVTISQAGASGAPQATAVVNAASYQRGIAAAAWISIFGSNLSASTRAWRDDEIVNGVLPTELDGVSVTINGKPAAISYISPAQINVQAPTDDTLGAVQVQVTTDQGTTATTAEQWRFGPGLFLYDAENRRYAAAQHSADYSIVGKQGLYASSTPAKPGEIVTLYGTGFGATNPASPTGQVITQPAQLANPVRVSIGGLDAAVRWAGLSAAGLYQFNVEVPEALSDGDAAVVVEIGGSSTQSNVYLTVQR